MNPKILKVGSFVSTLSKTNFVSGIQRVVVETNTVLKDVLNAKGINYFGTYINLEEVSNNFRESDYLASDVLLNGPLIPLSEVDLLFISDCTSDIPVAEILKEKKIRKLPVISILYDILPVTNPEYFPNIGVAKFFASNLLKQIAISDVIICISEITKQEILKLNWNTKCDILVVPLGALGIDFQIQKNVIPHTIICVGTIEPRKGHNDLLDAFDLLREKYPDLVLIIAGRLGWNSKSLEERIMSHSEFGQRLKWFDSPTNDLLERLYSVSTLAIAPSRAEGFGLNIEEALSRSIKVLARDIPIFNERSYKNLYHFSGNGNELAKAICRYLDVEYEAEDVRSMLEFSHTISSIVHDYLVSE